MNIISYLIARKKTGGTGSAATLQTKTVTPTTSAQQVIPDSGYDALSKVTVSAIPSEYVSTTDATATSSDIVSGKTAYSGGQKVTGTIPIYSGTIV